MREKWKSLNTKAQRRGSVGSKCFRGPGEGFEKFQVRQEIACRRWLRGWMGYPLVC